MAHLCLAILICRILPELPDLPIKREKKESDLPIKPRLPELSILPSKPELPELPITGEGSEGRRIPPSIKRGEAPYCQKPDPRFPLVFSDTDLARAILPEARSGATYV